MAQKRKKKNWLASLSPFQRTALGILVIAFVVFIGVVYGPHYDTDNTTTGDTQDATVTINGLARTLTVNRSLNYRDVKISVTNVELAQSFSDDGKSQYGHKKYVLRVNLRVQALRGQQGPLGLDFARLGSLILSDGSQVHANLAQISPDILPGQDTTGFLDFWVNSPYDLSQLGFDLAGQTLLFRE